jgi:hypothetical protein
LKPIEEIQKRDAFCDASLAQLRKSLNVWLVTSIKDNYASIAKFLEVFYIGTFWRRIEDEYLIIWAILVDGIKSFNSLLETFFFIIDRKLIDFQCMINKKYSIIYHSLLT